MTSKKQRLQLLAALGIAAAGFTASSYAKPSPYGGGACQTSGVSCSYWQSQNGYCKASAKCQCAFTNGSYKGHADWSKCNLSEN